MAIDKSLESSLQGARFHRGAGPPGKGIVVGPAGRRQLVYEPEGPLPVRQRVSDFGLFSFFPKQLRQQGPLFVRRQAGEACGLLTHGPCSFPTSMASRRESTCSLGKSSTLAN